MSSSRSNVEDVMNMAISSETAQKTQIQRRQEKKAGNRPGKGNQNQKVQEAKNQLQLKTRTQEAKRRLTASIHWPGNWR
jgi:hypothetical protein